MQVPVRHTVAVPVRQPYPVPVTVRQRVPYPVPVPVILTPHGLLPIPSINLSSLQNAVLPGLQNGQIAQNPPSGLLGGLSRPLPMLSPLAINAPLGQGTPAPPPEGLADIRDPALVPPIEDNFLPRGQLQDPIPWDTLQAGLLNDPIPQGLQLKWKRSTEEKKEMEQSSS